MVPANATVRKEKVTKFSVGSYQSLSRQSGELVVKWSAELALDQGTMGPILAPAKHISKRTSSSTIFSGYTHTKERMYLVDTFRFSIHE